MTTEGEDRINDPEIQLNNRINKLLEEYAQCDADSAELTERRTEIRKQAKELGFTSAEFQEGVRKAKKMSERERLAHEANVKRILDLASGRQAELWPEEAEKVRKREEEFAAAQTTPGPDPDTNPRSNPASGGAKPMTGDVQAAEQAEGAAALESALPKTKKAQSTKAAEKRAAAGLN